MEKESDNNIGSSVEQAINRVLEAEREAKKSISECELQAQQSLNLARQKAQRINVSSNARITKVHQRCQRIVIDEKNRRKQQQNSPQNAIQNSQTETDTLRNVVSKIATLLTTPEHNKTSEAQSVRNAKHDRHFLGGADKEDV